MTKGRVDLDITCSALLCSGCILPTSPSLHPSALGRAEPTFHPTLDANLPSL